MVRKLLVKCESWFLKTEKRKKLLPLFSAIDHFLYEPLLNTKCAPHLRDAIDLKRWMFLVVLALFPCTLVAIFNTGLQDFVYTSGSYTLMEEYLGASTSIKGYFTFIFKEGRFFTILSSGALLFLPVMIISYTVGGLTEAVFAIVRRHEIAEGFLVSGLLYPLILPPTLPYWMVALGVFLGIVIGKEIFGGTGMNILNPALTCRAFLYFAFPAYMSGEIWAGSHAYQTAQSLLKMNKQANLSSYDAISGATNLGVFNISPDIKKVHIDAIAENRLGVESASHELIDKFVHKFQAGPIQEMDAETLQNFMTTNVNDGGLGLTLDNFTSAFQFAKLKLGENLFSDGNLFFGNILGSMGEVSKFAILLGAILLLVTKIGSWRTMLSYALGMIVTASIFQLASYFTGPYHGALNPAIFDFPVYKHFLIGGALFGLVFMATDPVSSPDMQSAKYFYGFLVGMLTIVIRLINPAYPEGVMLAILFGNVFAPLFDYLALKFYRRGYV